MSSRLFIGLMSGTSLDGVDGVLARIDDPATEADDAVEPDEAADDGADAAGPLTLAIDLQDAPAEGAADAAVVAP